MNGLLPAVLAAGGVALLLPPAPGGGGLDPVPPVLPAPPAGPEDEATPRVRRVLLSLSAGLGGWVFLTGIIGLVVGAGASVAVWVVTGRAEPAAVRRRRAQVRAELPHLVGLLAAAVRGGLPPADAVALVCDALPGPAADRLALLPHRIRLGVEPALVWRSLEADPTLAQLGRALGRSASNGAPVAAALERLGADLAGRARSEIEDAARRVGVRAAVPLGGCLLPAFLLLGIVPVVAGLLRTVTP